MNAFTTVLRRTLAPVPAVSKIQVRNAASSRRLTKLLRLRPHPSMILDSASPSADHIIYNPPSSAPTPLMTPEIFLPKNDARHSLFQGQEKTAATLPPPLREPYEKTYHLTESDMQRMRELRAANPAEWPRTRLAKEFNCSTLFVGIVCQASEQRIAEMAKRAEHIKNRWGTKRTGARAERQKRRAGWGGADGL
ncbi:mitochondrial ribosomal protein subunit L20-domain-containing protein [Pyronema omphalodes]|nr:mitochondrial ribosomal protein subunit L20-domain-containing protein [Pyronema omphalodes]